MKKQNFFIVTFIFIMGISSCKKDDASSFDRNSLITGSWRISASTSITDFTSIGQGNVTTDLYARFQPCQKDNTFSFNNNGTFDLNEGATKCSASDPQTQSNVGTWTLTNNNRTFTTDYPGLYSLVCEVLQLNNTTFQIKYTTTTNGYTSVTTTTYTKI